MADNGGDDPRLVGGLTVTGGATVAHRRRHRLDRTEQLPVGQRSVTVTHRGAVGAHDREFTEESTTRAVSQGTSRNLACYGVRPMNASSLV